MLYRRYFFPYNVALTLPYMYRYILTLMVDGMRAVRGFHLDKSAASVLTTCVSSLALEAAPSTKNILFSQFSKSSVLETNLRNC